MTPRNYRRPSETDRQQAAALRTRFRVTLTAIACAAVVALVAAIQAGGLL